MIRKIVNRVYRLFGLDRKILVSIGDFVVVFRFNEDIVGFEDSNIKTKFSRDTVTASVSSDKEKRNE